MDLRERVVAAIEAGQSCHTVAKLFDLGPATVVHRSHRQRTAGGCAPKLMGGVRHAVLLPERDWLLARIVAVPDATVRGLRAELAERGTRVSNDAGWRFLRNVRLTFRKNRRAAEQDWPDVARERERWARYQGRVAPDCLIFVDETGAKTNMTRTRGWATRGEHLVAAIAFIRWSTMTFLAGLHTSGITAPGVFDGPINGCLFRAWVEQCLASSG